MCRFEFFSTRNTFKQLCDITSQNSDYNPWDKKKERKKKGNLIVKCIRPHANCIFPRISWECVLWGKGILLQIWVFNSKQGKTIAITKSF